MAAIEAGKRNRDVIVLERAEKIGKKIAISGGGRCNFTNTNTASENFISSNPHFARSALARYTPHDFIALVERHGIRYHEKKLGQLFCDNSSREIIDMLRRECFSAGVAIRTGCQIKEVKKTTRFVIETEDGVYESDSLVIATGGLSIPKIGATDFGYRVAERFGLKITDLKPALVPLTFTDEDSEWFADLSGLSIDAVVRFGGQQFRENILVTHRGLSGPAILQISSYWNHSDPIHINLLPDAEAGGILAQRRASDSEMATTLGEMLPKRFARKWCERYGLTRPVNRYTDKEIAEAARLLNDWQVRPRGTEGYKKAEVTLGGVDTAELSSKTMESRTIEGLYFIGEVVDVTGQLGGYNFQWAWASGFAAGQFA